MARHLVAVRVPITELWTGTLVTLLSHSSTSTRRSPARRTAHQGSLLALALALGANDARGQACCSGSSANEFGIVARGNTALIGARLGQEFMPWTVGRDGNASTLSDATVLNTIMTLGGGFRVFSPRFQLQGTLPVRLQYRSFGQTLSDAAVGFGDAALYARFTVLEDDTEGALESGNWIPFLEPYVGLKFPSGRGPNDAETSTTADVMGSGDFRAIAGMRSSRFLTEADVIFASATFGLPFARDVTTFGETESYLAGTEWTAHLSYFRYQSLFWAFGASVDYRFTTAANLAGNTVDDSNTRRLTLGLQASYFPSWPSWQIRLDAGIEPPIDGVSKNVPFSGLGVGLSLERHFGSGEEPSD